MAEPMHAETVPDPGPDGERLLDELLREVRAQYGEDFSGYRRAHVWRRVRYRMEREGAPTLEDLLWRARRDPAMLARLRRDLILQVTAWFRDPEFYRAVREEVIPWLRTYTHPCLWIAGCATGEEVYSYLVLLHEEGLLPRARLYATDLDPQALAQAAAGLVDPRALAEADARHLQAGGRRPLTSYLLPCPERAGAPQGRTGPVGSARMPPEWLGNVVFSVHNLVNDASFRRFHFISCRNVLMYLDGAARRRALDLLHDSLAPLGVLGLGNGESLWRHHRQADYTPLHPIEPLYRRMR